MLAKSTLVLLILIILSPFGVQAKVNSLTADPSVNCLQSLGINACMGTRYIFDYITNPNTPGFDWVNPNSQFVEDQIRQDIANKQISQYSYIRSVLNQVGMWVQSSIVPVVTNEEEFADLRSTVHEVGKDAKGGKPINYNTLNKLGPMAFLPMVFDYPMQNLPAPASKQVVSLAQRLINVPSASAQGIGFSKLGNSQDGAGQKTINLLWTASRNAAYLIMVVLLIAAGFMVMFRQQISPQAVVTIQMVIPNLIISLLLVTFSYAIVGLVIDMIYVSIAAILGIYSISSGLFATGVSDPNFITSIQTLWTAGSSFIGTEFLSYYLYSVWNTLNSVILTNLLNSAISAAKFVPVLGGILSLASVGTQILALINMITMGVVVWALWGNIKIVYTLFMAYIHLIILTIVAPLQIMMDIIPGKDSKGFIPWIKCVIGNASVFVLTAVIVLVGQVIFGFTCTPPGAGFAPAPGTLYPCALGGGSNWGINGIFNGGGGFTLPFIGGGDDLTNGMLGDITKLGGNIGGKLNLAGNNAIVGLTVKLTSAGIVISTPTNSYTIPFAPYFSAIMGNTGYTFLLAGFINFIPAFITSGKKALCKGMDVNLDAGIEPLKKAFEGLTNLKPISF